MARPMHFFPILIALCVFPPLIAGEESFPVIRLPSQRRDVCGDVVPSSCPVKCFRADPVCGVDGVTYWCGCTEAVCAGAKVAKLGFCEVGNGGCGPQALLLVHIVWLILLGFSVFFGLL